MNFHSRLLSKNANPPAAFRQRAYLLNPMKKGNIFSVTALFLTCFLFLFVENSIAQSIPKEKWDRFKKAINNVKADEALRKGSLFAAKLPNNKRGNWENLIFVANEHTKAHYDKVKKGSSGYIIKSSGKDIKIDTTIFKRLVKIVQNTDADLGKKFKNKDVYELPKGTWGEITKMINDINFKGAVKSPNNYKVSDDNAERNSHALTAKIDSLKKAASASQKIVISQGKFIKEIKVYLYILFAAAALCFFGLIFFFIKYRKITKRYKQIFQITNDSHSFFEKALVFSYLLKSHSQLEIYLTNLFNRLQEFIVKEKEITASLQSAVENGRLELASLKSIDDQTKNKKAWNYEKELREIGELMNDTPEFYPQLITYATTLTGRQKERNRFANYSDEQLESQHTARFIYFKEPSIEGYFEHNRCMLEKNNQVLFRFDLSGNAEQARFSFETSDLQTVSQALSYSKYKIEPVCEIQGVHSENATKVLHLEDGKAELNNNGQWVVTKKAKVIFQ